MGDEIKWPLYGNLSVEVVPTFILSQSGVDKQHQFVGFNQFLPESRSNGGDRNLGHIISLARLDIVLHYPGALPEPLHLLGLSLPGPAGNFLLTEAPLAGEFFVGAGQQAFEEISTSLFIKQ